MNIIKGIIKREELRNNKDFKVGDIVKVVKVFNASRINRREEYLNVAMRVTNVKDCGENSYCRDKDCMLTHERYGITAEPIVSLGTDYRLQGICSCYCHMVKIVSN